MTRREWWNTVYAACYVVIGGSCGMWIAFGLYMGSRP